MIKLDRHTLDHYASLRRRGDAQAIANKLNLQRGTVYVALQTGRCSQQLADAITEFYLARAKEVENIIDTIVNTGE